MTVTNSTGLRKILGYLPKSGPPLYTFIAIVVVAFSLGLLLSSGEKDATNMSESHESISQSGKPTIWTCSMHPQVKLPEPGKCPICFMDLIPLDNSFDDDLGERQLKMSAAAAKLAQIVVSPVRRDFAEAAIRMVGKIDYDETRLAYITAWVPGRIDSLYADYTGITVKRGDPMVLLYSPDLLSAQEELIQAKQAMVKLMGSSSTMFRSTAKATVDAAREKLRLLGLTSSQIDEIETSEIYSSHININAPIGGVVIHMNAREGIYVKTGTPIYTIADLSKVWVLFDAYETDLAWLKEGQKVEFKALAIPGKTFTGTISFIDPILSEKTRTVKVRIIADNKSGSLKPGMFVTGIAKSRLDVNGKVVSNSYKDKSNAPLLIPTTVPLLTGTRAVAYVQVANEDGFIFEGREIELGARAGDYYIVKSGLSEGELVVTNGAFKLDSELQIQAKPSMMTPEGGGGPVHQHGGNEQTQKPVDDHTKHKSKSFEVGGDVLSALAPLYDSYFKIQMALADDNLSAAKDSYAELKENTQAMDMSLFKGDSHMAWMNLSDRIIKHSGFGEKAKDIEKAREEFFNLSKSIIDLRDSFGHGGDQNFYLTFCPMADNNKGAYWLQAVDTVFNSFYGSKMLRCGSIKDTLEPRQ